MGVIDQIYNRSPLFFQNIMVSCSGYQRNLTRYGRVYYEHLRFLAEFDSWPLDKKIQYQTTELIRFVRYAFEHSRFYRNLYQDIDINSLSRLEDLRKLPVVDKEMLRENIESVFTVPRVKGIKIHTGGTTGTSLGVLFTPDDMMKRMATLDHFKKRVGFEHLRMRRATFNGKRIVPANQSGKVFWRYNSACKQMIYSAFHINEENLKYYVESLNDFRPHAIDGFFMSICDVAGYIERHGIKLSFKPIAIFPTSETLTESGRELLERVFKCKVYDQYASAEGAPFVTECPSQVKHVELSSGVFENLEGGNDEILVTSFTTHGTPLIRYRIGDSMLFEKKNNLCACGTKGLIVKEIRGRRLDFLYASNGAKVRQPTDAIKKTSNSVIRAQFVQDRIGEVLVKLEVDESLYRPEYDDLFRDELTYKLGRETKITIEHVDAIPREKSGKFRVIKNNVVESELSKTK